MTCVKQNIKHPTEQVELNTPMISILKSQGYFCAEKYLKKGLKILVSGRIQTGSYVNQEGNKVYATNVIVEEHYFAEGKKLSGSEKKEDTDPDGFMHLPDGEELPFE